MSKWSNPVTVNFRGYVRRMRQQSNTTTRELANAIGKSSGYITHLEKGLIKSIPYDTAFAILDYINNKSYLIAGKDESGLNIRNLLIDSFGILPDDHWEKMAEEYEKQKQEEEKRIRKFEQKINELIANLNYDHEYFLDFALKFISKTKEGRAYLNFVLELLELDLDLGSAIELQSDLESIIKKYQKEGKNNANKNRNN